MVITHDGSMVLLYMVTWIPSIYPSHVSLYIYIYQHHGSVMGHGDLRIPDLIPPGLQYNPDLRLAAGAMT